MWADFKAFLIKQNILALAIAFVVGVATNTLVQALVDDFIMPIVAAFSPAERWEEAVWDVGAGIQFRTGHFFAALLNFFIIGLVAWRLSRIFLRPPGPDEKSATRPCPYCKQVIDATATRCSYCTSQLAAAA